MAYIGSDRHLMVWLGQALPEESLVEGSIQLVAAADRDHQDAEPAQGFIICKWFGPFLLGPASNFLRGRC